MAGEGKDHLHDVLDDDERDAACLDAAYQFDRLAYLDRGQPGQRFVQQQQTWLRGQRPGDLEALATRRAQCAGRAAR